MAQVFENFDAVFFDPRDPAHEDYLRKRVEQLSPLERIVALQFDEIHTAEKLTYEVCSMKCMANENDITDRPRMCTIGWEACGLRLQQDRWHTQQAAAGVSGWLLIWYGIPVGCDTR